MRLLLIRHGQTDSNIRRLLDTAVPGPALNELGQAQAQAMVEALADQPLEGIYSSVALRAQQTARPLAEARGMDLQVREGVREISAGNFEMSGEMSDILAYLEVISAWMQGDRQRRMPGAETGNEVLTRCEGVIEEARAAGQETIAIVSHGGLIRTWAGCRAANVDPARPQDYDLGNTGTVVLQDDSGDSERPWRVLTWTSDPAGGPALADPAHDGSPVEAWNEDVR